MEPKHMNPLDEVRHIKDELHFERGVLATLREISKGRTFDSLFTESIHRVEILESRRNRLEALHGNK